jgi:hypothetical protein
MMPEKGDGPKYAAGSGPVTEDQHHGHSRYYPMNPVDELGLASEEVLDHPLLSVCKWEWDVLAWNPTRIERWPTPSSGASSKAAGVSR